MKYNQSSFSIELFTNKVWIKREKMKSSKLILLSMLTMFLIFTLSHGSNTVRKPFAKHQQLNPGLDAQVKVVSMIVKNDLSYTIVKLPINGTLYYDGVQISEVGFTVVDPNKLTIDPKDGDVTVVFEYTSTDREGVISEENAVIMPFTGLEISGSVFHDHDGNGIVDGEKISELEGKALYVSLVDHEEKILASKDLTKEGTFSFNNSDGIQPYNNYALIISTEKSVFRSILPTRWSYSGESISSLDKHKDELKDGIIVVHVKEKNITQIHFGLAVRPLAKEIIQLTQLNPGVNRTVTVPKLDGNDSESGNSVRYMITALPDNATLYNNGKKITEINVEIKDPDKLTADPDNSDQIVEFEYVTADEAGVVSHPATVTLPFVGLKISGILFADGDGDARVNGKTISHIADAPMYATLLNEKKISDDLENNWAVVAEAIQTILRREAYPNPYEALKGLTRTNEKITRESIKKFIDTLEINEVVKKELKAITPGNYTGI